MKKFLTLLFLACITIMAEPQPIGVYTVQWVHGPMGRVEQTIENDEKITDFLYDKCGRLATKIKPDGTQLHREYDDLGRLSRYYSHDFDYTYDQNDHLLSVIDCVSKQTTTRKYDPLGDILEETLGTHFTFKNTFDRQCRRIGMMLPDGSQITYVYSGWFLDSVSRNGLTYTYTERNLEGRIMRIDLPADLGEIYLDWDPCGRWKKIMSPYFSADYTEYDPVGNLSAYTFEDSLGKQNCYYEYDALDQLIAENDHSYVFDSLYNRREKDYSPYAINNMQQVISDGSHPFIYDPNGNLLSDGKYLFAYDSQDRLIEIRGCRGDRKIVYTYDPFHRRLTKTLFRGNKEVEKKFYLWDGDNEIGVCDKNGKIEELRILGEGLGAEIGSAVLLELKGKIYVPIHDHRGCVVTLVEAKKKQAAETYRYTAFGEELTDGKLSPWRFASKRVEEETGLIFFGRRYYSPFLGRWISPDPQGYDNGPNLYAYLSNSPLTDYDLYGLWSMREAWGNAQNFMWGMLEGSAYHFSNMASSFCMRDFSSPGWQPRSLLSGQDTRLSNRGLDFAEKTFLPFTYEARHLGNDASQHDLMRARGRAFGGQAITLGGLFGTFSAGKGLLNISTRFQEAARFPAQELSREYLFSGKPSITETSQTLKGTRNRFKPDSRAEGAHSVFRRDPVTGKVTHYETFRPQTNPYDPKPWESVVRFDAMGKRHLNKFYDLWIDTPHIHDPYYPGGIRSPYLSEMPK